MVGSEGYAWLATSIGYILPTGKALEFIVIGAREAGTSSLFEHLRAHPSLYLPPAKGHPFFSDEAVYGRGWPEYVSRDFLEAPAEIQWGKVSHHYMYAARVGVRLSRICFAPAALESSRRYLTDPFITWGEYGRILQPYYEAFSREQIFICFIDELSQAPLELMQRLFRFLEVPGFVPPALQTRFRQAALSPRFDWLPSPVDLERRLATQSSARSLWRRLPATVQKRILLRMQQLQYRFSIWNMRPGDSERLEASAETVARLRVHYESDRLLLEELIGQPVPWAPGQGSPVNVGTGTA